MKTHRTRLSASASRKDDYVSAKIDRVAREVLRKRPVILEPLRGDRRRMTAKERAEASRKRQEEMGR